MHDQPIYRSDPPARAVTAYSTMFTVRVLEHLAARPHSVPELARAVGLESRSCRRLLQRLQLEGYVVQDGGHRRRYRATLRLVAVGVQQLAQAPLPRVAAPILAALARDHAGNAHLWVAGADGPVCLAHANPDAPAAARPRLGLVGEASGNEAPAVAVLAPARRRKRSCAYSRGAESTAVAAAVVDRGDVVAAVGLDGELDVAATAAVAQAAAGISRALADAVLSEARQL